MNKYISVQSIPFTVEYYVWINTRETQGNQLVVNKLNPYNNIKYLK